MKNLISTFYILNSKFRRRAAFTLVELMLVVAILGILAAIVLPEFQNQSQVAKESAAKANIKILREAIERYALDHNGVPPGYLNGNTTSSPNALYLINQLIWKSTNASGQIATFGTQGYPYGPYLPTIPRNPFNGKKNVIVIIDSSNFPSEPTKLSGWIYKPATQEVRIDAEGADSSGVKYFDY